jgi:formiminoglutamase/agmatinase
MTGESDGDDRFVAPSRWTGPSADPVDEQFGDVVDSTTLAATDHDAVIVGEPYDGAVIGRRGAADAPAAIREELATLKTRHLAGSTLPTVGDLGDVAVPDGDVAAVQRSLAETTRAVHALDALPVFLGGDNSLTVANVTPLLDQDVGVVNLDAHLDVRRVRDGPTSGTPFRQLHDAGLAGYVCLGARHFETAGPYVDTLDEWGWQAVPAEAVGDHLGVEGAVGRALDALSEVETLYVSVDCDVLDAAAAPGVSAPTPGGLSTRELFSIVRRLCADPRLRGVEVVECAPPLDASGRTVAAAARVVAHALAGAGADTDAGAGSVEVTG